MVISMAHLKELVRYIGCGCTDLAVFLTSNELLPPGLLMGTREKKTGYWGWVGSLRSQIRILGKQGQI